MAESSSVPGPRGSRWLGMGPELRRDQLGTFERAVAEYGDVVRLVVGPPGLRRELYLVTHPDGVEQVLAGDPDGYSKNTPIYEEVAAYLGNGLLTSGGARWRQQRRTVAPLFSHRRIDTYIEVMADEAARWQIGAASLRPRASLSKSTPRWLITRCVRWAGCSSVPMSRTPCRSSGRHSRC